MRLCLLSVAVLGLCPALAGVSRPDGFFRPGTVTVGRRQGPYPAGTGRPADIGTYDRKVKVNGAQQVYTFLARALAQLQYADWGRAGLQRGHLGP